MGKEEAPDSDYSDYERPYHNSHTTIDDLEERIDALENAVHNSGNSGYMGCLVFILLIAVLYLYIRFVW